MNDDPGSTIWSVSCVLVPVGLVLAFLFSGGISALVTLLRMQSGGFIADDRETTDLPVPGLLARGRGVLLSLSVGFLTAASLAASSLPRCVASHLDPGFVGWIGIWAGFFAALLLGSMLTKALALSRPVGFAKATSGLIWMLYLTLWVPMTLLRVILERVAPSLWAQELSPPFSGQEIRGLLADEEATALMEDDELNWARSIFELGDTELREIMVPRIDVVGLDVDTPLEDAVQFAAGASYTRLPVWEGSQDRMLGLLHTKDLLKAQARGETPTVRQLLRRVHYLPESKKIDEALAEFREGRIHLAIVVDEYGGTAGIVTLEDILEEIVGEIRDEFDQEGELVRLVDDHQAVIDPRIDLDDLNDQLGLELPAEENDTLGGLLYALGGKVPTRGDTLELDGLQFTVDRVERQRIKQVTLRAANALRDGEPDPLPRTP